MNRRLAAGPALLLLGLVFVLGRSGAGFAAEYPGGPDGLAVDRNGFVFGAGPGGVYVFSPAGEHLGTIRTGVATSNCAWGDDGSVLYVTASDSLLRIQTAPVGAGW